MRPDVKEVLQWLKVEPPTVDETKACEGLKPGEFEIYSEKVNNYLAEAREIFIRMGVTSMLRSGDNVVGYYNANGDAVYISCGTMLHAISAILPLKYIIKNWVNEPTVGVRDGDIFYCNEALYGGVHNPDQYCYMPVFNDGELIGWTASGVHEPETGGAEPGGMILSAKSRHDEGMKLPPIKVGENFQLRADLIEMCNNFISRAPRMQELDMRARATACDRLRMRLKDVAKEKGNDFVSGLFRKFLNVTEDGISYRIRTWNDGIYRAVVFRDNCGLEESLLRIFITMRKEGDHLNIDLNGTSPEHGAGSILAFPWAAIGHGLVTMFGYLFHDLPPNSGAFTPIEWNVPEGSIYWPGPEAPVSDSPLACWPLIGLVQHCYAKMIFDSPDKQLVVAGTAGDTGELIAGVNQHGVPIADLMQYCLSAIGQGARSDRDGTDAFIFAGMYGGTRFQDIEEIEDEFHVLHLYGDHRKDSCGFGKYRGGSGLTTAYVVHHVPWGVYCNISASSRLSHMSGLFGGYPPTVKIGVEIR
ncbi:MAG: hydantoinase B/oxoprolinase family protein, partial [Thermodesulfobacteriota bacterium]|nr:hydantoinase B/oxoprolinase family protein [Thermodesulfobacteriota bacterium]